ncbi:hypothetical protein [Undibacterium sp. TC4M20W]|uniref:hypothetical protein n=1 Tax=Undibacterium sp. TC4M20W TaxID=3413052 RepID=UPI003BF50606
MLSFLKLSFVRNVLIAWFLLYLINMNFSAQYMRNILGLPVLLWMAYNVIVGLGHNRRERKKFEKRAYAFCKYTDDKCIDIGDQSAISLDYDSKTIYLMNAQHQIALKPEQIMRWETGKAGDVIMGTVANYPGNNVALSVKEGRVSHVTFWIRDGALNVFTVLVSSAAFVDRLKHFSLLNNIPAA